LFGLALVSIVIPMQTLAIPLFTWISELGMADRLSGVILPGMMSGLGVMYFTQVFRQVPLELLEAARLEGASEMRVFRSVLPLARGGLISFGLVHFILSWHEHLIPLLVLSSPGRQTLPLALAWLNGAGLHNPVAVLMAGSTVAVLPVAVLYALAYRRFKSSLADLMA
jgi:multiple sugar transport system permease protein